MTSTLLTQAMADTFRLCNLTQARINLLQRLLLAWVMTAMPSLKPGQLGFTYSNHSLKKKWSNSPMYQSYPQPKRQRTIYRPRVSVS